MKFKEKKLIVVCAAILLIAFVVPVPVCSGVEFERYKLSLPDLDIQETERIDSFTIVISYGDVIALPRIPIGWSINIDNAPLWKTTVNGSISVGAAALTRQEVDYFREFMVIQRNNKELPVRIEAIVTSFFETSLLKGKKEFKNGEFNLQPIKQ